jgi:protein involved in polysaccharide export with SLBB domain
MTRSATLPIYLLAVLGPAIAQNAQPISRAQGTQPAVPLSPVYKLEPGDDIEIRFVTSTEYNDRVVIRPDGRISLLSRGEILAAGLTVAELTASIKESYSFLKNPDPTVQVRGFANRRIYVGGEVARPGPVPIMGPKTIAEAVMESGGLRETAHRQSVILIRKSAEETAATYIVPMYRRGAARGQDATTTMLQPYDVVLVTESTIAKLDRGVDQYIRRMIPGLLTAGFTYLRGNSFVPR